MLPAVRSCIGRLDSATHAACDTPSTRARKAVFVRWVSAAGACAVILAAYILSAYDADRHLPYVVACCAASLSCFAALFNLLRTKSLGGCVVGTAVVGTAAGVLLADLAMSPTAQGRLWPLLLPGLLLLEQLRMPRATTRAYAAMCCAWLLLLRLDKLLDLQFRSLPGIPGESVRIADLCGCAVQPCNRNVNNVSLLWSEVAVVCFAAAVSTHHRPAATEPTAEGSKAYVVPASPAPGVNQIMRLVADLDVAAAEGLLRAQRGSMDPGLAESLDLVLENLKCFRPFLPDALLERVNVSPPSSPSSAEQRLITLPESGEMAVVFTDIRCSTTIWEQTPDAMKGALQTHNSIVRHAIDAFQGYEVKTIGDAFMVAFADVRDALNFALQVQEDLADATWPEGLVTPKVPRDDAWRGLILRIGVNAGPVSVEVNEVTGRSDLFGHTVNKASRFESNCIPGFVAISQELYEPLKNDKSVNAHTCAHTDKASLAGVSDVATLCHLAPSRLQQRAQSITVPRTGSVHLLGDTSKDDREKEEPTGDNMSLISMTPHARLTTSRLERVSSATTGAVRLGVSHDADNGMDRTLEAGRVDASIGTLMTCLERTGGHPVALVGTIYLAGWNTTRSCPSHVDNALRFVHICSTAISATRKYVPVNIGLARGSCMHGNVGSASQRYLTVFGPCVQLSMQLAAWAHRLDTFGLFTTLIGGGGGGASRSPIRPVALWDVAGTGTVTVYEVNHLTSSSSASTETRNQRRRRRMGTCDKEGSWGWTTAYWEAFEAREYESIREHAEGPADRLLLQVADQMESGDFCRHHVVL